MRNPFRQMSRLKLVVIGLAVIQIATLTETTFLLIANNRLSRQIASIPDPEPTDLSEVTEKLDDLDTKIEEIDTSVGEIDSINLKVQAINDKLGLP